ncbi:MAG: hypothetical protein MJZ11_05125 [Lachnospiraceae bacterium]|nr:hypothetical protein [Lachnospiraceae bacterium]
MLIKFIKKIVAKKNNRKIALRKAFRLSLDQYIDKNYEGDDLVQAEPMPTPCAAPSDSIPDACAAPSAPMQDTPAMLSASSSAPEPKTHKKFSGFRSEAKESYTESCFEDMEDSLCASSYDEKVEELERKLGERLLHTSDTFSEYLMYLIESKGMKNSDVYKRAMVDKRYFSKIKNTKDFHPEKIKALCLCIGAKLNLDETKDLLARAGYALSPCDLTDIIFSFFIEHEHYDLIDIDIQLEEHGLECIIG